MAGKKLYIIMGVALFAGYTWLFLETASPFAGSAGTPDLCIFRNITGMPCPSCGSTRSVMCLLHGDPVGAININPLGIPVALILVITPVWLLFDLLLRKRSFYNFYCHAEAIIRRPPVAFTLATLVVANWIWNITKGL